MGTTQYIEGAAGIGLLYFGFKKSGWEKWALIGVGAYLLYSTYQAYSGTATST